MNWDKDFVPIQKLCKDAQNLPAGPHNTPGRCIGLGWFCCPCCVVPDFSKPFYPSMSYRHVYFIRSPVLEPVMLAIDASEGCNDRRQSGVSEGTCQVFRLFLT